MRVGRDASRETKGRGATAAQAVCTGEVPRLKIGSRARAECTRNMELMVVTPDVSKLSGWLKADSCRAEKGKYKPEYMRLEVYMPGRGAATAQAVCMGRAQLWRLGARRECAPETCCPFL